MTTASCRNSKADPFLCWAGGKSRLIPFIASFVPSDLEHCTYWEPFLGAGSLFFALHPSRAILSDLNADLISCFRAVRQHHQLVAQYLRMHASRNSKAYYYAIRSRYNKSRNSITKSAMFIYLNKTCFNGIWRVNKKGEFNVPYGYKEPPALPSMTALIAASNALKSAKLMVGDFREILQEARAGDFVYLDPPYPPLNKTAYFTHYTQEGFEPKDQIAVAEVATSLDKKGCRVLISNADTKFIRSLYDGFRVIERSVIRWIRTDGKRYKAKEILILNYER
jgi:DNA adenine methylase